MGAFDKFIAGYAPQLRSIARIMLGLLVLQHGTIKHLNIPVNEQMNAIGFDSIAGIAGIFELICGTLLIVGLFSRVSAFLLSGLTASAYFLVYAGNGFFPISNGGELAAVYCFAFLWLAAEGPGPWSLDARLRKPTLA